MRKYFLMLLFLLPFFAWAANNNTITVNQSQPQFTITLAGNPTTGYSWLLDSFDGHVLKLVSSTYVQNQHAAGMVGVPGHFVFTFEVLSAAFNNTPQTTEINFAYARPWATNDSNPEEVRYTVSIVK